MEERRLKFKDFYLPILRNRITIEVDGIGCMIFFDFDVVRGITNPSIFAGKQDGKTNKSVSAKIIRTHSSLYEKSSKLINAARLVMLDRLRRRRSDTNVRDHQPK